MTNRIRRDALRPSASRPGAKLELPPAIARSAIEQTAKGAEAALLDQIEERRDILGDGQANGGGGNVEINERRAALSVLMSRLDPKALETALKGKRRTLSKTLAADLAWLKSAERQKLSNDKAPDLRWAANGTSTPEILSMLASRRAHLAESTVALIETDPSRAYDASGDNLSAHLAVEDSALRSQILADALLQFRATRRSSKLMDFGEDGVRDGSVGRIASSGPLATIEQRLACQDVRGPREYALLRLAVASHPHASTNSIFQARNAVAVLAADRYLGNSLRNKAVGQGEGLDISLYDSIHKNYSANTPKVVEQFFATRVFPDSSPAIYAGCVEAASAGDLPAAQRRLAQLKDAHGYEVPGAERAKTIEQLSQLIYRELAAKSDLPSLRRVPAEDREFVHRTLLGLYSAIVETRPSETTLEKDLFYAGKAWREVAALIHALRTGPHESAVEAAGAARLALRAAFDGTKSGFDRQMLLRLDRQVELLSAELLGSSVTKAAKLEMGDLSGWAVALRSALRGVEASGLDAIRHKARTAKTPELGELATRLDKLFEKSSVSPDELRSLSVELFRSASELAETLRGYFRRRELAIHFSGLDVELDPEFSDSLVKETSLHYLLSLAQAGMMLGVKSEISASKISATEGMRVLSSIGPAVYQRVLVAKDLEQLLRFGPTPDDFCVVHHLDEKSMVAMGGLLTDTEEAPGGYSHLSVFAKGHGISALALPELRANYGEFFGKLSRGGGLYVDDRPGSFVMMPLQDAMAAGLADEKSLESLRPGFNHSIKYFDERGGQETIIGAHEALRSAERPTREIELYVPDLGDRDQKARALSLEELGAMPFVRTRHLAGEKGAVLARLRANEQLAALGVGVPGGASIPPYRIASLLRDAKLFDRWMELSARPKFLDDRKYRLREAAKLQKEVESELSTLLLSRGKPTAAGRTLLAELEQSADLKKYSSWIARSSFTGEDRPNKSGAGQYESYAQLSTPAARLRGVIGVIASAWGATPIENNLQLGIDLRHIFPSVLVQRCLKPTVSGVAISRGGRGELGEVSYQAVPGFGGGVAGGRAEEGVVGKSKVELTRNHGDRRNSLLSPEQAKQLREAVLIIEREFQETIEPGKGWAVDVEWAIEEGRLHIVQARVIVDD